MQKITPFLWFNGQAEEAMNFYVSIFKNAKVLSTAPGPDGKLMSVTFELDGQQFMGINGGPQFPFTEAISFFVHCEGQEEVDEFWEKLSEGGSKGQCGWLKDKYGVSWQIIPKQFMELMQDKDPARAGRVMQAMLKMTKLDVKALQAA
jgi:predicted 3-demethylubiquinone-9 3-methyltransferase (glyoxalase superfamily)